MAAKKKHTKAKSRQKVRRKEDTKPSLKRELTKIVTGFIILVFVVVTIAMFADYFLNHRGTAVKRYKAHTEAVKSGKHKKRVTEPEKKRLKNTKPLSSLKSKTLKDNHYVTSLKQNSHKKPMFEIFDDTIEHVKIKRPVVPLISGKHPVVSIIIDDIGFDRKMAYAMGNLNKDITFSILPGAPFGKVIARMLHKEGIQVMLHLPMEPVEYPKINPGPGAILAEMQPDQLLSQLRNDLGAIPYIKGVNNHMGSRITTMSDKMRQIFTILKEKHLFFIDSRTTKNSVCRPSAALLRIPFAQRDVFLDNIQSIAYIKRQLKELIHIAQKHGTAIAIGHPYKATYTALKQNLPMLRAKVKIVPASDLVSISG